MQSLFRILVSLPTALAISVHQGPTSGVANKTHTSLDGLEVSPNFMAASQLPLVIDIGFNAGDDSLYYLSKGNRVVGVDALPPAINQARRAKNFAPYLDASKLELMNVGIVADGADGKPLDFWVNDNSVFSSFDKDEGCTTHYNGRQVSTGCHPVKVQTTTCAKLVEKVGTPFYIKIDIEGFDTKCILSLAKLPKHMLPKFVSFELVEDSYVQALQALSQAGYVGFKGVPQEKHADAVHGEWPNKSGPYGEDAVDEHTGRAWRSLPEIMTGLKQKTYHYVFMDVHARLG